MISMQHPDSGASITGWPAAWVPFTPKVRFPSVQSLNRIAIPSMVARLKGGDSRSATIGSRRKRPRTRSILHDSEGSGANESEIRRSASATEIMAAVCRWQGRIQSNSHLPDLNCRQGGRIRHRHPTDNLPDLRSVSERIPPERPTIPA